MRKIFFILSFILLAMITNATNPLFKEFNTPHQTPPFNLITEDHYEEAIKRGLDLAKKEIESIASNPEKPTFENTIVAMSQAGADLTRALGVFFPLTSSLSDDRMIEITNNISPLLSEYSTSIILNQQLWERIKAVYDNRDQLNLDTEDKMLLENTYESFASSGANLQGKDRDTFASLNAEISDLTNKFGQNVLRELNSYKFYLTDKDLDGLPESLIEEAAIAAKENGHEGEYMFTLAAPVYSRFLKYSSRRDLREKMWRVYNSRNTQGEYNNLPVMTRIVELRRNLAKLLGADTYAAYTLKHKMAKTPDNVMNLLNQLSKAYRPALEAEMKELNAFASEFEGKPIEIKPWDYSYYSEKLKKQKYDFDTELIRPYFELNNVIDGVFGLATKLYGLKFTQNPDIAVYHPDVKAFDVTDADGSFIGVLYTDFFPRESKTSGAWMTNFAEQYVDANGKDHRPVVSIVMNFSKPVGDKPSLLTPDEVNTFLHEFGHALHGLLTKCKYEGLSGTNVYRDFVELPSQFNENYLTQQEFLNGFARHYQTGEPIPAEMIDRLVAQDRYGAAYACMRQLMFGLIDMAWHNSPDSITTDPATFEHNAYKDVQIFEPVDGALTSPQFSHIFAGGYAAGYYSYKWAEVLDADAFSMFKEKGIFDRETARSFRTNILERGGTEKPDVLYRRFRGQDPTIEALLKRDGITPSKQ